MVMARRSVIAALGMVSLARVAHGAVAHRLTILHVNDFHSRHEPVDGRALTCTAGEACFGGSARLATAIRMERAAAEAEGRAVLLLDGGDQFQGSLFFTAHQGMAELAVQHAIGVDAMTIGNHEFDAGPEVLGRYVAAALFPVLAANVDAGAEPALAGRLRPFAVLERAGLRIGIVGVTTMEALTGSSPGPRVAIADPAAALTRAEDAARNEGARLIIALTHVGVLADAALAGPAVIVGGHSHTLLSSTEPGALGPHPVRTPSGALLVQAGAYGRYLGRLDLDVAADGTVLAHGGACRHIGLELAPDPEIAAIVAAFAAPLQAVRARQVGVLAEALDISGCRVGPCLFGALVAGAMLGAGRAEIAIMNAGGLRTGLRAGPVTLGDVLDAQPFGNTLATFGLRGSDVVAALEQGLRQVGRGAFPQVAGARYRWDGPALVVEVKDGGAWQPIEPGRMYRVATNNFVRGGGDGYTVLRDRAIDPYDAGPGIAELTAEVISLLSGR